MIFREFTKIYSNNFEDIDSYAYPMETIPLFPLNLVLFPGAQLPLRIFEPRYTDLVSECLRSDTGFGVCFIKDGDEVGGGAQCYKVGTYARIIDWSRLDDGLLGITVEASRRFRVEQFSERANKLLQGDIQWLDEIENCEVGHQYLDLQELMGRVLDHFDISYENQQQKLEDPTWLGYRLVEFLPLDPGAKQALLEMSDTHQRLGQLQKVLNESNFADMTG